MALRGRAVPLPLALVVGAVAVPVTSAEATAATTGFHAVDITSTDGVVLKANIVEPTTPGRHPAVVFVSSWGLNDAEYVAQADRLARGGDSVPSYTARGVLGSGGQIDTPRPQGLARPSAGLDRPAPRRPPGPAPSR